ncbi:MAG: hypothetical protein BWY45_02347 [Euryarchaeota archaeon ADurb.Bin294]|nr:MAG: hypothetical protein BWY45_02347 [Euryarchaeota archaeon ADurb.Bin294]
MAQASSLVVPCITTTTSPRSDRAVFAAHMPFMTLSLLGRSADRCEPTKTTGTGVFIIKLMAAALYAMVSVP